MKTKTTKQTAKKRSVTSIYVKPSVIKKAKLLAKKQNISVSGLFSYFVEKHAR
jgi:hypothetical protein